MTATKRSGFFRFSWLFPENPTVIIDVNSDEGDRVLLKSIWKNKEIIGYNPVHRIYNGNGKPAGFKGYFVAKFDKEIVKYRNLCTALNISTIPLNSKTKNILAHYVTFNFQGRRNT